MRAGSAIVSYRAGRSQGDGTPATSGDLDNDGIADLAVYRPSSGSWFVRARRVTSTSPSPVGRRRRRSSPRRLRWRRHDRPGRVAPLRRQLVHPGVEHRLHPVAVGASGSAERRARARRLRRRRQEGSRRLYPVDRPLADTEIEHRLRLLDIGDAGGQYRYPGAGRLRPRWHYRRRGVSPVHRRLEHPDLEQSLPNHRHVPVGFERRRARAC